MTDAADIAIVSFDKFINGDDADKRAVAKQLYNAFSTVGWVYVKDHGIPQERVDEIFGLAKSFFDLPLQQKITWRLQDAELNQGYTGDGDEANGGVDHKECYEHRRFRNPSCPTDSELPGFRETIDEFYGQCYVLGLNVLKCLAIAMDLGEDFFTGITKQADPQLRLIHYPAIEKKIVEQEGHARIIPHTDFGLCTLLFQDSVGGLEVDPFHTGDFKAALPVRGTVLINIADLLQRLTNDRCRSTIHRVVSPKTSGDILPSRYSIPFFIHPDPDVLIDPVIKEEGEVKKYEPVNAGEWRTWNTQKNYKSLPVAT
ncbi:Clavaminate synthase-like protein [Cucurbitaria berberidis CBS 394.84]|uniref:Clavaminate synthase-like protein n=1 Tax=Cucurbitaria berberidis CBS 394.84 TaxID=1168544 RepID=A0A9P4GC65_9PLEO|nr:Clavaminate synthase-like protein [Cucurbitaria berberidis CBS 394.84]KAF1842819.1 Clavaminate synthase-like protein [Cucurbitaria berberidis CBS 394.84]